MFTLTGHTEEPKVSLCVAGGEQCTYVCLHLCMLQCMALRGCLAASGSWDNTLRVWNIHVGMCKYTLQGHSDGEDRKAVGREGRGPGFAVVTYVSSEG